MKLTWETTLDEFEQMYLESEVFRSRINHIRGKHKNSTFDTLMACVFRDINRSKGSAGLKYITLTWPNNKNESADSTWRSGIASQILDEEKATSVPQSMFVDISNKNIERLKDINKSFLKKHFNREFNGQQYKLSDENINLMIKMLEDIVNIDITDRELIDTKQLISGGVTQLVLTGAPGTGKTYMATRIANDLSDEFAQLTWKENNPEYELVQFHPSYDYTDFIEGLRPVEIENKMVFKRVDGQFKQFCRDVIERGNKDKKYLFIIDEINRADLSKVFGELMYSLETDKRGPSHRIATQYDNLPVYDIANNKTIESDVFKDGFYIPENVIIIGTMNDIDRSVESMDFALRRRFHWYEVEVTENLLEDAFSSKNNVEYNYFSFIEDAETHRQVRRSIINQVMKMNREVINAEKYHLNEAYYISQGYFKHLPEKWVEEEVFQDDDVEAIVREVLNHVWNYSLDSLLTEYVRGETYADEFVTECQKVLMDLPVEKETDDSQQIEEDEENVEETNSDE